MFKANQLFWLTGLRYMARYRLRTALTLLGVIVGVTTFIFGPTLAFSISRSLDKAIEDIGGKAQLEVRTTNGGINTELLDTIQSVEGVRLVAPMVNTGGVLIGHDEPLAVFGVDSAIEREVRTYELIEGKFLSGEAGGILLTAAYAQETGLAVGQQVTLLTPSGTRTLTVVGTLAKSGIASLNGGDVVVIGIDDAKALRGGKLDTISILLTEGQSADYVTLALKAVLPASVVIEHPQGRSANIVQIQVVISGLMFIVSSMILLVGSSLIFNTMAVAVAQRWGEIGVLRALGARRDEVRSAFVVEAGVMGFIGSAIGTILGVVVVRSASQLPILPDFSNSTLMSIPEIIVPIWLPPLAIFYGTVISILAGYLPSRSAARVDPVEALTPARVESGFMAINHRRVAAAGAGIVVGVGLILTHDPEGGEIIVPLTSIWMLLGAAILLLPTFLVLLGSTLPNLMHRLFGLPGLLAAENLTKRPKRMTTTAAVLLIAVWAGVVVSSGNFGYRQFADEWNSGENVWDLIIAGPGKNLFLPTISLPDGVMQEIAARPDVAIAVPDRLGSVRYNGIDLQIRAIDIAGFRSQNAGLMWKSGDQATAYDHLQDSQRPALLMSAALAGTQGMKVGDTLTLETPTGTVAFEVVGTVLNAVRPGTPFENSVVLDLDLYRSLWSDSKIDRLFIKLQPGSDLQAARRELLSTYALKGVIVISPADMTAALGQQLDSIVVVSQIMSALLMGTLVVGIANTLFIVVLDRRREMGTLRALGLRARQITASVVIEAGILVIMAAMLAVPLGIVNNYVNTLSMENVFGLRFALSVDEILISLLVILATTLLAAYFPARHAGRVDVLSALRYE